MKMTFPTKPTQVAGPLIICCFSLLAFIFDSNLSQHLALTRSWIDTNEFYRLLTGHFLHTNFLHLVFNLIGVLLLWLLHGDYYKAPNYIIKFVVISCLLSLLLYFFSPDITFYVGLSGAIHGVFAWGCLRDIENKLLSGWLLLIGLCIKVGNEQIYGAGSLMPDLIDASVATDSHLFGALLGLLLGLLGLIKRQLNSAK